MMIFILKTVRYRRHIVTRVGTMKFEGTQLDFCCCQVEFIKDSSRFITATSASAADNCATAEQKEEDKKQNSESEDDDDVGFGRFG